MPSRRPPRSTARRLTRDQLRRRLEQLQLELAAIGGGYGLPQAELRRRALALFARARELLERFPE